MNLTEFTAHTVLTATALLDSPTHERSLVALAYIDGRWWSRRLDSHPDTLPWPIRPASLYNGTYTDFMPALMADVENITPTLPETPTDESPEKHRASQ